MLYTELSKTVTGHELSTGAGRSKRRVEKDRWALETMLYTELSKTVTGAGRSKRRRERSQPLNRALTAFDLRVISVGRCAEWLSSAPFHCVTKSGKVGRKRTQSFTEDMTYFAILLRKDRKKNLAEVNDFLSFIRQIRGELSTMSLSQRKQRTHPLPIWNSSVMIEAILISALA